MNGINIKESLKEIHARIEQAKKNRPDVSINLSSFKKCSLY